MGREVATWADLQIEIGTRRPNRDVGHPASRWRNRGNDGSSGGAGSDEYGDIMSWNSNPMVDSVISGDIAQSAGFQAGDIVLAINGDPVVTPIITCRKWATRTGIRLYDLARGTANWNCERHRRIAATARRSDRTSPIRRSPSSPDRSKRPA